MTNRATTTGSDANAAIPVRSLERGITVQPFYYTSGTSVFSATQGVVLLCKIPHGATVLEIKEYHSTGAASCPAAFGYALPAGASATLSVFATAFSQAGVDGANPKNKASTTKYGVGLPYKISLSDDVMPRFVYLTGAYAPASATASLVVQGYVAYTMDGIQPS